MIVNTRPRDGRWIDSNNACRNVSPAWTEMSYSYSLCRDFNYHTGIERCVMYRSNFRTFPSFLNPRAHSAHYTWTTLWSFRNFSNETQSSFILSTITEQWKFSYRIFTYIRNELSFFNKLWFHCPLTIKKSVSQKSQNRRCSTVPAGRNLDLNRCTCNDRKLSANWQWCANRAI